MWCRPARISCVDNDEGSCLIACSEFGVACLRGSDDDDSLLVDSTESLSSLVSVCLCGSRINRGAPSCGVMCRSSSFFAN